MMLRSTLRSLVRRCLAGVAMFGFSLNVATPTIAHGCAHPAQAGAAPAAGHHVAHRGHESSPEPAQQPAHGNKCHCVGHSCGTALAVPTPVATGPRNVPAVTLPEPVRRADRLPAAAQHLLPFSVGPPRSIAA